MKYTKATVTAYTGSTIRDYDGYTFDYEIDEGVSVKMGIYKNGSKWYVIDLASGLEFVQGKSRKDAELIARCKKGTYLAHIETHTYLKQKERFYNLVYQRLLANEEVKNRCVVVINLESVEEWARDKDGLRIVQNQGGKTPEKNPIWVLGDSKKYQKELKEMGFHWGKHKVLGKGWHYDLARA